TTSTVRPVSRVTRARTSSINSSSLFHLHPVKVRRLIFSDRGLLNAITQLIMLNSIAKRHRSGSPCAAAGRLFTVRSVIRLSYALVWVTTETGSTHPLRPHRISSCRRDSHPLEWQLASLHGQLRTHAPQHACEDCLRKMSCRL